MEKHPIVKLIRKPKNFLPWVLLIIIALGIVGFLLSQPGLWPGGYGFGKDKSISTEIVEKDKRGNITKIVETTKHDDGKTLWDWLSVLGVPLSLLILGSLFQILQQQRAEEVAKAQRERDEKVAEAQHERDEKVAEEQREIAEDETKEEVLQVYFDRLSVLLVDKNLLTIAAKINATELEGTESQPTIGATAEERVLLASAMVVIRARTLSILRRFENDPKRKTSVIWFLIEAAIILTLKLNLSDANLSGVDFSHADLSHANFSGADLSHADLSHADFSGANFSEAKLNHANLSGYSERVNFTRANLSDANFSGAILFDANFSGADLSHADLSNAILIGANFSGADLSGADLRGADLRGASLWGTDLSFADNLTDSQLQYAKLCKTKLPSEISLDPNRDCDNLGIP
jgi:Pentapeptide repeats (8 copies)